MSDRTPAPAPVPTMEQRPETAATEVQVKEEESSPTTSVAQTDVHPDVSPTSPAKWARRSEAERRAFLLGDPQAQEVLPRRVLCQTCQTWIRLSGRSTYALSNWHTHKERCSGSTSAVRSKRRAPSKPNFSPSSRVATAERRIILLNDSQVRACSPSHVLCSICKSVVALDGEVDYDLTRWTEHKAECIPMTPAPISSQGSASHVPRLLPPPSTSSVRSRVSVGESPRSPTPVGEISSSNSAETTAVTEHSPAPAVKVGIKRAREEETGDEEKAAVDERPTNRARTETYKPPAGVLGWFIQPLKEFARGFREGLGST